MAPYSYVIDHAKACGINRHKVEGCFHGGAGCEVQELGISPGSGSSRFRDLCPWLLGSCLLAGLPLAGKKCNLPGCSGVLVQCFMVGAWFYLGAVAVKMPTLPRPAFWRSQCPEAVHALWVEDRCASATCADLQTQTPELQILLSLQCVLRHSEQYFFWVSVESGAYQQQGAVFSE